MTPQPLTGAQVLRLWHNAPKNITHGLTFAQFARMLRFVEEVHQIGRP